jgi:hypothetical protein
MALSRGDGPQAGNKNKSHPKINKNLYCSLFTCLPNLDLLEQIINGKTLQQLLAAAIRAETMEVFVADLAQKSAGIK